MKTLLNPWFIAGCLIWLAVTICRNTGHLEPYVKNYINDAFALPVITSIVLCFLRVFVIKSDYYVLAPWHIVFIVTYVSVVFEGILPRISNNYTADWADVVLYAFGGIFFYRIMNKPLAEVRG